MRTIKQTLYSFDELSEEAKEKAIEVEREDVNENGLYYLKDDLTEECKDSLESNGIERYFQ